MGKINKNRENPREKYKLTNWSSYNKNLKNRGKLTIWLYIGYHEHRCCL